uniref:Major facilitator superfamily (MFS) profile domain-containing protein n=1 Tax=Glossina morsitans morsitans TaxID=37546 RepID=A0A1B0FKZ0_GLOMM
MNWNTEPEDFSCPGYRIDDKQTCVELMNQVRPLFKKPYVVPFLGSCVVMSGLFFLGNGLGIWFTYLRNRRIDKDLELHTICENMAIFKKFYSEVDGCQVTLQSFRDSMLLGVTYLIMFNVVALLLRNISSKVIVLALQLLCFPLGGALPWLTNETATSVVFIIFLAIPNCLIALVSGIVIEFTSVDLRAKALCLCILIGRFGMVTGTILVGYAMDVNCELTYTLFSLYPLACSFVSVLLPGRWKCFSLIADQPRLRVSAEYVVDATARDAVHSDTKICIRNFFKKSANKKKKLVCSVIDDDGNDDDDDGDHNDDDDDDDGDGVVLVVWYGGY